MASGKHTTIAERRIIWKIYEKGQKMAEFANLIQISHKGSIQDNQIVCGKSPSICQRQGSGAKTTQNGCAYGCCYSKNGQEWSI